MRKESSPVSGIVKRFAITRPRQKMAPIQARCEIWVCKDIGTACKRRVDLSAPERIACEVDRGEAGRTSSVDRVRWTCTARKNRPRQMS